MRDLPLSVFDGLELKVTLRHIAPPIWRALRVPARLTLTQLHDVLQVVFGWTNSHLHDFTVGDIRFSLRDLEDEIFSVDERGAPLGAVGEVGTRFLYRYDYGDDWEHDVVESIRGREEIAEVLAVPRPRAMANCWEATD